MIEDLFQIMIKKKNNFGKVSQEVPHPKEMNNPAKKETMSP